MEDTTPKTTASKKAVAKKTTKKGINKAWLIVGVLIVLALGGANIYYMKKNKELRDKLAELEASKKPNNSINTEHLDTKPEDTETQDRQTPDQQSSGTPVE